MYAQVIVDINHANVDRIFEYVIPEQLSDVMKIGMHVVVPFGNANRPTDGFVIHICETTAFEVNKLKSITRLIDDYSILNADQIDLAYWMKGKYNCLLVDALRLMLTAQHRRQKVHEKKVRLVEIALDDETYQAANDSLFTKKGICKAPLQKCVLDLLHDTTGALPVSIIHEHIPGSEAAIAMLIKKGWITQSEQDVLRRPYSMLKQCKEVHTPTKDQAKVISRVISAIEDKGQSIVLRGVTGSGKTEVYMCCISRCMELGKTAIMLVPEISLTPQTVARFRNRFGDVIAVLHSRLSAGERFDEWRRIRYGEAKVVIGARSAVFAPVESLGLIVIDEEHESSYRSDKSPRYDAIEVAKKRCEQHNATLLLGSATPSLETWCEALHGEFAILELPHRINGQPLPNIEIVDMRKEMEKGNRSIFSDSLYVAMRECYFSGHQMILFLNRRGYSTFVSCRGCGYVMNCSSCDVSMTYHKNENALHCHYCGNVTAMPQTCPSCGKPYLKYFGVGTQQIEEQVLKLFPGIRVLRMDYDTTQKKDSHLKILSAFAKQEADVLIGTQMIAKGLDFPKVTLVGVVAADLTLYYADFRSAERTFQLITQVAGRAGRDKDVGNVVVQTYSPSHPSIRLAAEYDYEKFYQYEIESRRKSEFPPFTDFVRFLFADKDETTVKAKADEFKLELENRLKLCIVQNKLAPETLIYIASTDAPLHYLRGENRNQVILKLRRSEDGEKLLELIRDFAREKRTQGIMAALEINPQNMI